MTDFVRAWMPMGWAGFLLLFLISVLVAAGMPTSPLALLAGVVVVLFAYRYPYMAYGVVVALVPFQGITVSLPTGEIAIGQRVFGGAIDVTVGEVIALALVAAWACKVALLWLRRRDTSWKPWLPLAVPMALLVAAHLCSIFAPFRPDVLLILKYTVRPVLWCYVIYVALTVNFVRSRRRLMTVLGILMATGLFAAIVGFISFGVPGDGGMLLPRARPLPLFGIMPLGDNHNQLAEWLAVTIPCTLALLLLTKEARMHRLLGIAAIFQTSIALLTFARTVWIVLALEAICFAFLVWRERFDQWIRPALIGLVFLLPIGAAMAAFSSTALVQSSTSTRLMLSQIAVTLWQSSPWVGMGAGTFVERVGSTQVFLIEYGAPLDSHGFIQKILAETGVIGLAALAWLLFKAFQFARSTRIRFGIASVEARVFTLLAVSAGGAFVYQLFNTNYWSGKMWLPLGIMLAASRALAKPARESLEQDRM